MNSKNAVSIDLSNSSTEDNTIPEEELMERRREFFESLNLSSDVADEEDNWVIDKNTGYPKLDVLPNVGEYNFSAKNKDRESQLHLNNRLRKRYNRICKVLPDVDLHRSTARHYLNRILMFDIGVGIAVDEVSMELQEADLPPITTASFNTLQRNKERVESLLMLQGLIRASGLTLYEDEILSAFIPSLFKQKTTSKQDIVDFIKNYSRE